MNTITLDEAQATFTEMVESLCADSQQIKITSESGSVIMMSETTYENLLVTLEFLSAPGLLDAFRNGACNLLEEEEQLVTTHQE